MPKLQMSPPWLAGITSNRDAEYIDAVQPGLVLRIRRGRMVWFVRYLFDGSARRYRIGQHPAVGLSAARKLASVVRGRVAAGDDPQSEKRAKREVARRRRLGATVGGALATWLRDAKLGPVARWKDGLEGGSAQVTLAPQTAGADVRQEAPE
jgi:Arm domain-containing DNA-binding protein